VYGPVRTVVWQGSAGDRRPYADLVGKQEVIQMGTKRSVLTSRLCSGLSVIQAQSPK